MVAEITKGYIQPMSATQHLLEANGLAHIFAFVCQEAPQDFQSMTLVCKNWKIAGHAYYRELHQRIAPAVFGRADFIKYIGGDSGDEFPIPLKYLVRFKSGRTLLTLVPKHVQFIQPDGTVVKEPCTLQNMGRWALNAKGNYRMGYRQNSWKDAILEKREIEEAHWSFVDLAQIERGKSFSDQQNGLWSRGEELAGLSDLCFSLLMAYVKTGIRHLSWGEKDRNWKWVRVQETHEGVRLCLCFPTDGLRIVGDSHNDKANDIIGVVVARKSFGLYRT